MVMRVSAESQCAGASGSDPYRDSCNLRLLLDGTPYALVDGYWQPATVAVASTQLEGQEFAANVGPGTHHVALQWGILNGTGSSITWGIASARLIVEAYRQS